jgi:predicted enzyme related to lactoylglutathione lyase
MVSGKRIRLSAVVPPEKDARNVTTVATAKRISPMLAVENMDETIAFYQNVLGFTPTMKSLEYSIMERDGQTIHFMKAASEDVMKCVRGHTEIYIEVSGIRVLWEHVKTFKDRYRMRDLFDREYGMTEFHIGDPNGCLVFVGEKMSARARPIENPSPRMPDKN